MKKIERSGMTQPNGLFNSCRFSNMMMALVLVGSSTAGFAQTVLTEMDALRAAWSSHPALDAAAAEVDMRGHLENTAFSLASPVVSAESPTGEFYTVGVSQSFDFPSTYVHTGKVLKAETALAENKEKLIRQLVTREVRMAFAQAEYAATKRNYLHAQDSVLEELSRAATRQLEAGEIDYLEKAFAGLRYGEIHQQLLQAQSEEDRALQSLILLCGLHGSYRVDPMNVDLVQLATNAYAGSAIHPELSVANGEVAVAREQTKLERSHLWPGFQVGYLNQAGRDSPMDMRFQAGITVPLWFWQYDAKIKAARSREEYLEFSEKAVELEFQTASGEARAELISAADRLNYYLGSALEQAQKIGDASLRFFTEGERDYTTHLRTMADVMQIKMDFIAAVLNYRQARALDEYYNGYLE